MELIKKPSKNSRTKVVGLPVTDEQKTDVAQMKQEGLDVNAMLLKSLDEIRAAWKQKRSA